MVPSTWQATFEAALAGSVASRGAEHPHTVTIRGNLAVAYLDQGRPAEAVPLLATAVDIGERTVGVDHPDTARARRELTAARRAVAARSAATAAENDTPPARGVTAGPPPAVTVPPDSHHQDALQAVVGPGMYRRNAFRVTGLPVHAGIKEVRRHRDEARALARLGAPARPRPQLLALDPPPTADTVDEALQAIGRPDRRLLQELFWFWPDTDDPHAAADPAVPAARHRWERQARDGQQRPVTGQAAIAVHNLAVLTHAQALDAESAGRSADAEQEWAAALTWWRQVLDTDGCWAWLQERVRQLNDPRLTATAPAALRRALPAALLSVNAALAGEAVTARTRRRQLRIIRGSEFPAAAIDAALTRVAEPAAARLRAASHRAVDAARAAPADAAATARAFLDEAETLLDVLDDVRDPGDAVRDGAHDQTALAVLDCVFSSYHETQDSTTARELLRHAEQIAVTTPTLTRLRDNLTILDDILRQQQHAQAQRLATLRRAQEPRRND